MRVILLQDIKGVGKAHDVVEVKDGYAKNFLIKNKLAVPQTNQASTILNKQLDHLSQIEQDNIAKANVIKQQIESLTLAFNLKSNQGNTFGAISHKQIIDELEKHNIKIDKFMIDTNAEKHLVIGHYSIKINLYKSVVAQLKINIGAL